MTAANDLARISALLADTARASIVLTLFDGRTHSAKELAIGARVTPQTASWHLASLARGELVAWEKAGRERRYRLASPLVAQMVESVLSVASVGCSHYRPDPALCAARTCYDHLAGRLGVAMTAALVKRRCVVLAQDGAALTRAGVRLLADLGVDVEAARRRQRIFCRSCLDWTERRAHLAGAVGAALAARCFELEWIKRTRDSRAVAITDAGRLGFAKVFGVTL